MCIGDCYIWKEDLTAFCEELSTEREFGNFVDHYAVIVKNDSSDDVPSRFENPLRSDPACYVVKYSK